MFKLKGKLIIAVMVIFGITAFMSCEKEDEVFPSTNPNLSIVEKAASVNRHYFDNGNIPGQEGIDYGCKTPAASCSDDVIILAEAFSYEVCSDIIDNHNAGENVQQNDIDIFNKNKNILIKELFLEEDVNNLILGKYILEIRGPEKKISYSNNNYYKFIEKGKIKRIYPIKLR